MPKPTTHRLELPAPGPSVGLRFPWQPQSAFPPMHLHRSASTATQHDEAELSAVEKINVGIARRLAKGEALVVVPGALVPHDGDAPVAPVVARALDVLGLSDVLLLACPWCRVCR